MKYKITMHRFEGVQNGDYCYTIWFNKSLNNTDRMDGMCKGLDKAEKQEYRIDLWDSFRRWLGWKWLY